MAPASPIVPSALDPPSVEPPPSDASAVGPPSVEAELESSVVDASLTLCESLAAVASLPPASGVELSEAPGVASTLEAASGVEDVVESSLHATTNARAARPATPIVLREKHNVFMSPPKAFNARTTTNDHFSSED
jgi:hypothetical protein